MIAGRRAKSKQTTAARAVCMEAEGGLPPRAKRSRRGDRHRVIEEDAAVQTTAAWLAGEPVPVMPAPGPRKMSVTDDVEEQPSATQAEGKAQPAEASGADGKEEPREQKREILGRKVRPKAKSEKEKEAARRVVNYEYLDHTADIQLHSWGSTLKEAFEWAAVAMFGYMTELDGVDIDEHNIQTIEAEGHDMMSLLYNYLNEWLAVFATEDFIARDVKIIEFDEKNYRIVAQGFGERFDLDKHEQGTEVKAITYSAMQILETPPDPATGTPRRWDVYVILDI